MQSNSHKPESGTPSVQAGGQGEPKFTLVGGDDGSPSMLEELMRGVPGSFVVSRTCPESVKRAAAEQMGLRVVQGGMQGGMIDGGFIMGPGLDGEHEVIGELLVEEPWSEGTLPPPAAGWGGAATSPCGGGTSEQPAQPEQPDQPDHRKYDADLKAEAEKQATAQLIADLIGVRQNIVDAIAKFEAAGLGSIDERVKQIAGIKGASGDLWQCDESNANVLTAYVKMQVSEHLEVVISWEREVQG